MKSAIEELFDRNLGGHNIGLGKSYWELQKVVNEKEHALLKFIKDNEEAVTAFREFSDAYGESLGAQVVDYYKEGFRHGFRIALDALNEE